MAFKSDFAALSNDGLFDICPDISSCYKVSRGRLKPPGINVTKIGQAAWVKACAIHTSVVVSPLGMSHRK